MAKTLSVKKPAEKAAAADAFVAAAPATTPAAQKGGKAEVKRLTIDLPPDLHKRFKLAAGADDTTMVDLVRKWIEDYVAK